MERPLWAESLDGHAADIVFRREWGAHNFTSPG